MSDRTPEYGTFRESLSRGGEASEIDDRTEVYETFGESASRSGEDIASQSPGSVDQALDPVQVNDQRLADRTKWESSQATEDAQAKAD